MAVPAVTPVTTPALVTDATVGALLVQVPPVVGDKVVVVPTQIVFAPVIFTTGRALMVTTEVGKETQPVLELVYIKVAVPAKTPVTTPELVTVATAGLLLAHVPPEFGDKEVVPATQMLLAPVILTTGMASTVTGSVEADTHPLDELVKLNTAVPAATPVTRPALVTVAKVGSLLAQVPPEVGETLVISPTQISLDPVRLTVGAVTITMDEVAEVVHPSALLTVTV